ncbi:MAG: tetratricopeptide repeat protein [Burkholderiaceae bacterium]|jgi:tetratricopeptide (TPR) repeat protein|nr:tetratricopeptide repeat protein [Burkholderiaceae bacterium]
MPLAARRLLPGAAALAAAFACSTVGAMDIDSYWEYGNPVASEARFRGLLGEVHGDERLEVQTQIARTYSLRRDFAQAHRLLDEVEPRLAGAGAAPRVRYLLERGRTFNSAGEKDLAKPLFVEAWQVATAAGLEGLAVDAAHMVPIVVGGAEGAEWTKRGVELARRSNDPKARAMLPALLNNHAWNLHDEGRYAEALSVFREAQTAWLATGRQPQGRIARWSVARCLRSLGRFDEALSIQRALEQEWAVAGAADGYVFEELAELLDATGRPDEAKPYFRRAADELGKDAWFVKNEPRRLARLRERGGG